MKNIIGVFKSSQLLYDFRLFAHDKLENISPYEFVSNLKRGEYDDFFFDPEHVLLSESKQKLKLFSKPTDQLECAKELYEMLQIKRLQANDTRLWTYLCLGYFREYIIASSKIDSTFSRNALFEKFFLLSNSISNISKNPLSKLWWGIHQTIDHNLDDPYFYSRKIFGPGRSELFFDLSQRGLFFSDKKLLLAFLDFIEDKPSKVTPMKIVSPIMLNHIKNNSLFHLTRSEIVELLEGFYQFGLKQK